jgi:acetyl esterase/lipase
MKQLILVVLATAVCVTPVHAQEETPDAAPESYFYGESPAGGTEPGFTPLKVFVFRPAADHPAPSRSALVVFHGGGWSVGSAEWSFGTARRFAEKGGVGVAVQYRLSDQKTVTPVEAMADACDAIRWVRRNAGRLDISPDRIVAYGWSAGAHLAVSAAIFPNTSPLFKESCVPNALVLKSPAVDVTNDSWFCKLLGDSLNAVDYSPVEHVHEELPPTLILQGRTDTVAPLKGVERFHEEMLSFQNRSELHVYDGIGHLFTPAGEPDNRAPNPDPEVQADAWVKFDAFLESLGFLANGS